MQVHRSDSTRRARLRRAIPIAVLPLAAIAFPGPLAAQDGRNGAIDPELLAGMEARSIGPAGMSGRIAALDAVEANPDVVYAGASTGGVWKSENRGLTWEPVFDEQPVHSIGALAIFQASPEIVWVGTGEGNVRNSTSVGNGVYRSMDGGRTWTHLGLENTERIHRIVLHPADPDVAYVAAMGRLWGENPERGVYLTRDGGATWEKILYVDERTGAADLAMDPENPLELYAAMWQFRRWPWFFRSGGPGSGLYVSRDGGESWARLGEEDGLPAGELGRIGIGISRSDPEITYAIVEAERNALLRSDDNGHTWRTVNRETDIAPRPFYYARVWVDPERPDRVYNVADLVTVSDDGGKSFTPLATWDKSHPDHHAFWISPADPEFLITGNDGGVYFSEDRGETWDHAENLPLAQFYHVNVDTEQPYHVYGGLQDNGSWKGPSEVWENAGIRNLHWEEIAFGDGFDAAPFPDDHMQGYAMSQGGRLVRWDLRTGERKSIAPPPPDADTWLRFNWNAGFEQDPFDPATIYYGSQFVHRSTDRGETWEIISPDLTTDNPEWQTFTESGGLTPDVTAAENYTTIIAIDASPVERGVIWVGTDDGRLHVSRDAGESWRSVEERLPGVPANTWIPDVTASHHAAGTAYVVFDDHRRSNWEPYVFRTTDFGESWTRIAGPGDVWGYALKLEEDPVDPDLLFLGTEFGLHFSVDGGATWAAWTHGVPTAGVHDLAIQPLEHDLVVATHGRSIYIVDDISPLRGLTPEILASPLHLFDVPDAIAYEVKQTPASRFPGNGEFRGENEPYGAMITFVASGDDLPDADEADAPEGGGFGGFGPPGGDGEGGEEESVARVKVEIADESGEVIRTFRRPVHRGVNRIAWNLRRDGWDRPRTGEREEEGGGSPFGPPGGPAVLPGTYQVTLTLGERTASAPVEVRPDPRISIARADMVAKHEAILRAGALGEAMAHAITRIYEARRDVDAVLERARRDAGSGEGEASAAGAAGGDAEAGAAGMNGDGPAAAPRGRHAELIEAGRALRESLDELEESIWLKPGGKGIRYDDDKPYSVVRQPMRRLGSSWDAPNASERVLLAIAEQVCAETLTRVNGLFEGEVAAFRARVEESGLALMPAPEPVEMP